MASLQLGAARRRRPVGPSAVQERNFVGLLDTTKIKFIFVGLAAGLGKHTAPFRLGHLQIL